MINSRIWYWVVSHLFALATCRVTKHREASVVKSDYILNKFSIVLDYVYLMHGRRERELCTIKAKPHISVTSPLWLSFPGPLSASQSANHATVKDFKETQKGVIPRPKRKERVWNGHTAGIEIHPRGIPYLLSWIATRAFTSFRRFGPGVNTRPVLIKEYLLHGANHIQ